jgi:hypothetical protein
MDARQTLAASRTPIPIHPGRSTTAMTDIRDLIKEVMNQGHTDPGVIAKAAALAVPTKERLRILTEVLEPYVKTYFGLERMSAGGVNDYLATLPASDGSTPRYKHAAPPLNHSPKMDSFTAHHEKMLRQEACGVDGYKPLGEFTFEDFDYAAQLRYSMAVGLTLSAEKYRNAGELLKKHNVTKFKDLPVAILQEIDLPDDSAVVEV